PPDRRLCAEAQRARAHRRHQLAPVAAHAGVDRHLRWSVHAAARHDHHRLVQLALARELVGDRRALVGPGRAHPLARARADPRGLHAPRDAGRLGDREAHRVPARPAAVLDVREEGARLMSFDMIAPVMFAGLVVFLLLGYPVAFSLAATGLIFAGIGIWHGALDLVLLQALPERVLGIMANSTLLAI